MKMKKNKSLLFVLSIVCLVSCGTTSISQNPSSSSTNSSSETTTVSDSTSNTSSLSTSETSSTTDTSSTTETTTSETTTTNETTSTISDGTYYNHYYDSLISWDNSVDLINQLYGLMRPANFTPLEYTGNWLPPQNASQSLTNFKNVSLVYSDNEDKKSNTNTGSSGWNREHAFPASLMTGQNTSTATKTLGIATDFHNLWASDSSANSSRGNKNYGVVTEDDFSTAGNAKYNSSIFEPNDIDKGKLVRSIFYIATMYKDDVSLQEAVNDNTSIHAIGNKSILLTWNKEHLVNRLEYEHNEETFKLQHNRNVFVDYPELVDYCFGSKTEVSGTLKSLVPSVVSLGIYGNESLHANYAIKDYKETYFVGDTFDSSSIKVVDVTKDFKSTILDSSMYTISNIYDSYVFTEDDVKTGKDITISKDDEEISIHVSCKDASIENALYKYNVSKGEFISCVSGTDNKVTLSTVPFICSFPAGTVGSYSTEKGLQFGTSKVTCGSWSLETVSSFSYSSKTKVNAFYFKANVASGETALYTITINGKEVNKGTIKYDSTGSNIIYGSSFTSSEGIVKLSITSLNKAFYLKEIGINAI